jgi:SlyX protein
MRSKVRKAARRVGNPPVTRRRHRVSETEGRLTELEIRFTEQQQLLGELSEVLYAQQRKLDRLEAEVDVLRQKLAAEPGLVDANTQEKPPHY